jgi:predicted ABC-type ATPase
LCVCIAGPNGSGMSTLTKGLRQAGSLENWIDPDVVAYELQAQRSGDEIYGDQIDDEVSLRAFRAARRQRVEYARELKDFGFETVFSHKSNVAFLEALKVLGYRIHLYFVCTVAPEINLGRVQNRVARGGHDVPEEKIFERYYRSQEFAWYSARLFDRVILFDNSVEKEPGRAVAEIQNGNESRIQISADPYIPKWIIGVLEFGFNPTPLGGFLTVDAFDYSNADLSSRTMRVAFLDQFLLP